MIESKTKLKGVIEIHASIDKGKTFEKIHEFNNLWTNVGLENQGDLFEGNATGYAISHVTVGDGSSTAAKTDTVVDGAYFSEAISTQVGAFNGSNYEVTNTIELGAAEAVGTIRKIGLIAFGPTTTLGSFDDTDPDLAGQEWRLSNYADVLMPTGKVKDSSTILKFIWRTIWS